MTGLTRLIVLGFLAVVLFLIDDIEVIVFLDGRRRHRRPRRSGGTCAAALDAHAGALECLVDHDLDGDAKARLDLGKLGTLAIEEVDGRLAAGSQHDAIAATASRLVLDDAQGTEAGGHTGRIATLGEEIRDPEWNIPKAIVVTLLTTMALYAAVAFVAVAAAGAPAIAEATRTAAAPLEVVARGFELPSVAWLVAAGAVTAMLGVLLNLLLGLSRVLLAMARRGDMPGWFATISGGEATPRRAVIAVGVVVGMLALIGNVRTTWSFSAFTVLVYYALTNLAALRLPVESRLYPRWIAVCGLVSCLGLAFWVEPG